MQNYYYEKFLQPSGDMHSALVFCSSYAIRKPETSYKTTDYLK